MRTKRHLEFRKRFGKDILDKKFDADMYKGGAYIQITCKNIYILEVSWECNTLNLKTLKPIKDIESLLDIIIDKSENDYYLIGSIYVLQRKLQSEYDKLETTLKEIYEREAEWMLSDLVTEDIVININQW